MKSELEMLQEENAYLRGMLDYERNKAARLFAMQDGDIADYLDKTIRLDLDAMRETAKYLSPDDGRRITRRLDRIERTLEDMRSKSQDALQKLKKEEQL